jgi:hypothetical protein
MRGLSGDDLLKLPVRLNGIELARPVDLVLDSDVRRAVGFELVCPDRAHRFLPLGAATLDADQIAVDSALAVVDEATYYLDRGHTLSGLRGTIVLRGGAEQGRLVDVVVGPEGELVEFVVGGTDGTRRLRVTGEVSLAA